MVKKTRIFCIIMMFSFLFGSSGYAKESEPYTYKRMKKDVLELADTYHLELKIIGQSEFGRDLLAVKLGQGSHTVLITGSHHGREWLSTHIIMKMIEKYASAYHANKRIYGYDQKLLDEVSIWFVPMVNPDGVMLQQKGIQTMPFSFKEVYTDMNKGSGNFEKWKANGLGVDLNRQYPAGWDKLEGDQPYASFSHYKGERPFETKETKALSTFTKSIHPLAAAAYHTSGRVIYWYYHNEIQHLQRDIKLVDQIANETGYMVDYPPLSATGGGYTDWFIQTYKRPGVTIELSYSVKDTNPPLSVFEEEWRRNKEIGMLMAKFAKNELVEDFK